MHWWALPRVCTWVSFCMYSCLFFHILDLPKSCKINRLDMNLQYLKYSNFMYINSARLKDFCTCGPVERFHLKCKWFQCFNKNRTLCKQFDCLDMTRVLKISCHKRWLTIQPLEPLVIIPCAPKFADLVLVIGNTKGSRPEARYKILWTRRKFRSQTSDNMDQWKSKGGKT